MDFGRYRHNYEGFYEKTSYQMSINKGRMTTTEGAHTSLVGDPTIQKTVWIQLEARHLNSFKNSFKETCKYVFSFILDDKIICSWWLDILNV